MKCSGEKEGCERCLANKLRCEYTRSGSKSRKGKKSSTKSSSKESPTSSSKASPKSTASSSSRRTQGSSSKKQPHSSSSSSSAKHHHHHHRSSHAEPAARTSSSADEPEGLLSQLDFSMFGPEDAFDLDWLAEEQGAPGGLASNSYAAGYGGSASHMHVAHAGYQQWADQSPQQQPPSQYATAADYNAYANSYPQEGYEGYENYDHQDPQYWSQGGHRQ